jgi:hypothetical protein
MPQIVSSRGEKLVQVVQESICSGFDDCPPVPAQRKTEPLKKPQLDFVNNTLRSIAPPNTAPSPSSSIAPSPSSSIGKLKSGGLFFVSLINFQLPIVVSQFHTFLPQISLRNPHQLLATKRLRTHLTQSQPFGGETFYHQNQHAIRTPAPTFLARHHPSRPLSSTTPRRRRRRQPSRGSTRLRPFLMTGFATRATHAT